MLGIALDGEGHLGAPAAVTAVARAADGLGYGSVWCIGPWASALVGAVAVVTRHVRIGVEGLRAEDLPGVTAAAGSRLILADRLPRWPGAADLRDAVVRLDLPTATVAAAAAELRAAAAAGVAEVVVRLLGDPMLDEALAAYAVLGELVEDDTVAVG